MTGMLQARAYNEHTRHYMNFLPEKQQSLLGMPMDTNGQNSGFLLKGDVILSERDILRVGTEYQRYRMSDGWSPVSAAGMMGGGIFQRSITASATGWVHLVNGKRAGIRNGCHS